MSDHDFDNSIRKKFDSLQTDYKPEAWENFKKRLPVPWYLSFFKTYGGWVFGGVSSAALLLNTIDNSKTKLFEDNSTLTAIENTVSVQQPEILIQTDTVYKYIYQTRYIDRLVYTEGGHESANVLVGLMSETKNDIQDPDKHLVSLSSVTAPLPENMLEEESLASEEKQTLKKKETVMDSIATAIAREIKSETVKRGWNFLNNIRPGVEFDYTGHKSVSFGLLTEVFLKSRFSVSTGVSISNSSPKNFPFPREFNRTTGKDFEEKYQPLLPATQVGIGSIKDIRIETSRIRVPVYMSYYVPITYRFDFIISTGTRLDLNVSENVYYTNDGVRESPFQNFESRYKPKAFNNLFYGMGVQYRYGRLYGQLNPYFEFPFSKPTYLISPNKFGINAAIKFSLK
jgi:hypothetical protein